MYNKAIDKRKLFYEDVDYQRFLNNFKKYFSPYLDVISFCLIPNHFHFMIRIKEEKNVDIAFIKSEDTVASRKYILKELSWSDFLSDQFRRAFSSHALFINRKYQLHGPLFMKKIKRTEVSSEQKYYSLMCYIHHNPIHHGLSSSFKGWTYSSYQEYLHDSNYTVSDSELTILGMGDKIKGKEEFIKMHELFKMNFEHADN